MNCGDISGVSELLKICDLYYPNDDTPEKYARKIVRDRRLTYVAVNGSDIVGFAMATYDGWVASVWHYCIHPDHRNTRVARKLIMPLLKQLKSEGADIVYGFVLPHNENMLKRQRLFEQGPLVRVIAHRLK